MKSHFTHSPHCSQKLLSVLSYAVSACFWLAVVYKIFNQQLLSIASHIDEDKSIVTNL
jgi:hypothetical protein